MSYKFSLALGCIVFTSSMAVAQKPPKKINIVWAEFSKVNTLNIVKGEVTKPIKLSDLSSPASVRVTNVTNLKLIPNNPFEITNFDFFVGNSRPYSEDPMGAIPEITPDQAKWFDQEIARGDLPDIFIAAGHQVISEGWHSHDETRFMFLPTFLTTLKKYPSARVYFNHIRLPILWGCNTMTNLEPHGPKGEYLSPEQIKNLYFSGPKGKAEALGSPAKVNTLEFYRTRLATEYGPANPDKQEYTRKREVENCKVQYPGAKAKYGNCPITNLDRIMPDQYLYDGSHLYNYPYMMKRIFPNANIVLGYSSASPSEDLRGEIFKATLDHTYADLNAALKPSGKKINNILFPLTLQADDPSISHELNRNIIVALRKNWTLMTDKMNRGRPSGSITPAYPDLDAAGILGAPLERGSHQYGPYESPEEHNGVTVSGAGT